MGVVGFFGSKAFHQEAPNPFSSLFLPFVFVESIELSSLGGGIDSFA